MRSTSYALGCLVIGAALSVSGCKRFQRRHLPVDKLEERTYPTCDNAGKGVLFKELLHSGPSHQDKTIVERDVFEDRGCVYAMRVQQDWPLGITEVEVLWDAQLVPLRIWKRMIIPGIPQAAEHAELRTYELRTSPVGITRRAPDGSLHHEQLLDKEVEAGRPLAVIGPGRGLLAAWIKRANLKVGEKRRELAIDVRALEKIEPVTLQREADMVHPELGKVAVYTFYGRESVFVDARGAVVGDLAGLLAHDKNPLPLPPKLPDYGVGDPSASL